MSGLTFLKNFIKKPMHTGAVWPSSPYLSLEMTRHVGLERSSSVVELGPGTALSGFMKRIDKSAQMLNVADVASLEATVKALGA